jgi:hypothetical protein
MAEAAMEQQLNIRFGCRCPVGGCSKPKQILGVQRSKKVGYFSERRARQSVYDHLTGSPWHKDSIGHEEACDWADSAEVETWQVDDPVSEDEAGGSEQEEGEAPPRPSLAQKRQLEQQNVWYDKPDMAPKPKKRAALNDLGGASAAASASGTAAQEIVHCSQNLQSQINQQTRNAFNLVKAGLDCKIKISYSYDYCLLDIDQDCLNQTKLGPAQAMSKAENALRTAARLCRSAYQTFEDTGIPLK